VVNTNQIYKVQSYNCQHIFYNLHKSRSLIHLLLRLSASIAAALMDLVLVTSGSSSSLASHRQFTFSDCRSDFQGVESLIRSFYGTTAPLVCPSASEIKLSTSLISTWFFVEYYNIPKTDGFISIPFLNSARFSQLHQVQIPTSRPQMNHNIT
jgi:hypothetical protein